MTGRCVLPLLPQPLQMKEKHLLLLLGNSRRNIAYNENWYQIFFFLQSDI